MEQPLHNSSPRSAPIPAVRAVTGLLAFAAAVTAFGLLTGSPEPGPARAAQPEPAPVASAAQPEPVPVASAAQDEPSATAESDGNVFIYH